VSLEPIDVTDDMRADAHDATHPRCEGCRARVCADPRCDCPEPAALPDADDPAILFCSRACRMEYGS